MIVLVSIGYQLQWLCIARTSNKLTTVLYINDRDRKVPSVWRNATLFCVGGEKMGGVHRGTSRLGWRLHIVSRRSHASGSDLKVVFQMFCVALKKHKLPIYQIDEFNSWNFEIKLLKYIYNFFPSNFWTLVLVFPMSFQLLLGVLCTNSRLHEDVQLLVGCSLSSSQVAL